MNGLPYYKAYPRDFIEGTIGMSFELKGAYRLILDLIYMQGGELPDDARYISGLLGCSIRKWKSLREELISCGKIQIIGEFISNYRAVSELETLTKLQHKQAENRSRPNKNKKLPTPKPNHTESDTDTYKEKNTSCSKRKIGKRLPDDWKPCETDLAKAKQALGDFLPEELEKFRDYWRAKPGAGGVKLDWDATWRNWVRNSVNYARGQPPPQKKSDAELFQKYGF